MERPEALAARSGRVEIGLENSADSIQNGHRDQARYPIIVAEWQRNSREIVRVALDRFNNRETIDIRSWWQDGEGKWRPGRGGLTLAVRHLPALADALADALQQARALGLIEQPRAKDKTAALRQQRYRDRHRNGEGSVTPDNGA
jgi:hypothetical protein